MSKNRVRDIVRIRWVSINAHVKCGKRVAHEKKVIVELITFGNENQGATLNDRTSVAKSRRSGITTWLQKRQFQKTAMDSESRTDFSQILLTRLIHQSKKFLNWSKRHRPAIKHGELALMYDDNLFLSGGNPLGGIHYSSGFFCRAGCLSRRATLHSGDHHGTTTLRTKQPEEQGIESIPRRKTIRPIIYGFELIDWLLRDRPIPQIWTIMPL